VRLGTGAIPIPLDKIIAEKALRSVFTTKS